MVALVKDDLPFDGKQQSAIDFFVFVNRDYLLVELFSSIGDVDGFALFIDFFNFRKFACDFFLHCIRSYVDRV